jgi:hypothetical protein
MTPTTTNLIGRKSNHSIIRIDDTLGFNNYVVVNEGTKDYYNISIAKNTTLKESVESEIFYTIKKNNQTINEDIYSELPTTVVNVLLKEVEEYVDHSNRDEIVDYFVDIFEGIGYKPRHIIYHDTIETTLDYEFLVIISGDIDTVYLSTEKDGDVYMVDEYGERNFIGNTSEPENIKNSLYSHIDSKEHMTGVYNDSLYEEAIKESFHQNYGFVVESSKVKIYDKKFLTPMGYVSRKSDVYKINEDLDGYGIDRLREYSEIAEVNTLITESEENIEKYKEIFLGKEMKIDVEHFSGIIIINDMVEVVKQWKGEPYPMFSLDIDIVRVDSFRGNKISGNQSEMIKTLQTLTDSNANTFRLMFPMVVRDILENIKKNLKYFGINGYGLEIENINF